MNDHGHIIRLRHPEKKRSTNPVVLSAVPRPPVTRSYPAAATDRVFVPVAVNVQVTFLSPRQMVYARLAAFVLLPAMFVHSIPRAYADEIVGEAAASTAQSADVVAVPEAIIPPVEQSVPPTVIEGDSTAPSVVEESVGTDVSDATPPVLPVELPVETPDMVTEEASVVTPTTPPAPESVSEATPTATTEVSETEESPVAPAEIVSTADTALPAVPTPETTPGEPSDTTAVSDSSENTGTQQAPATPGVIERIADALGMGDEEGTATPTVGASGGAPDVVSTEDKTTLTESVASERATSTDERIGTTTEALPNEVAPLQPEDGTESLAEKGAQGEEQLREELRKQVEDEFLRGCISFEASGYYCLNTTTEQPITEASPVSVSTVESAQGAGGNREIFVMKGGERIALTSSTFDNAFPSQDISGDQFVWQGMKGGRWQIFFGSLSATKIPTVMQVTDSPDSNFNPKVDGEHIAWQGWLDDNWEIFLATKRDARSPFASEHLPEWNVLLRVGPEWSVERLTTNATHDMFPALHGDIVTWQSREGGDWVVYAYSIATKKQTKLSSDGVKSERPRFAITWEERDQDGNSRLMSYDMSTGKKTDLTDQAKKVSGNPFREKFPSPISQPNQATLPGAATSTGTSTPVRGDDDAGGNNPLLP